MRKDGGASQKKETVCASHKYTSEHGVLEKKYIYMRSGNMRQIQTGWVALVCEGLYIIYQGVRKIIDK